jgi:hypothetical protein
MSSQGSIGFWVLTGVAIFICVTLPVGQTMSLIDYDLTVAWGLQEPASAVTAMGVVLNKAFAAADTAVYLPLVAIGVVGLWLGKAWGMIALAAALGITAYWPIEVLYFIYAARGLPGFTLGHHTVYTLVLLPFVIYALWGLTFLYRHRDRFR